MSQARPDFIDSPFFVMEPGNWHLKPGAPEKVKKEFEEYMLQDSTQLRGVMTKEEYSVEAKKLGYTDEDIRETIAQVEKAAKEGIILNYEDYLIELPIA